MARSDRTGEGLAVTRPARPRGGVAPRVAGAFVVALVLLGAAAGSSQAAVRYAVPGGAGGDGNCLSAGANCSLGHVLQDVVQTSDEVIVTTGTHEVGSMGVYIKSGVTSLNIHGEDGKPRPRITADSSLYVTFSTCPVSSCAGDGTVLRHLAIENRGSTGALVFWGGALGSPFTIDDVDVVAGSAGAAILGFAQTGVASEAVIRGTTAYAPGSGGGVGAIFSEMKLTMRNVTAVAPGNDASAFVQTPNCNNGLGCSGDASTNVFNTILEGGTGSGADVKTTSSTNGCGTCFASVSLDYSSFDDVSNCSGCSLTAPGSGHNQTGQPLLANIGGHDFHELTLSPTVDAGLDDPANGSTDPDGDPRTLGTATDIGADEYNGPPPPRGDAGSGTGGSGAADRTPPIFASASLTNSVFAVDSRGPTQTPVAARRAKKGTAFKYAVSEPGRVVFTVERIVPGRRVGRKCRKPSRTNRGKRKCDRYKPLGRFAQQASAGGNAQPWSGKIGRKKAAPGRYRVTLVATDLAGNRSTPKVLRLRVVRR